jgi:hypothetical protein
MLVGDDEDEDVEEKVDLLVHSFCGGESSFFCDGIPNMKGLAA